MRKENKNISYIISEEKCSEKPFSDWFEIYKAICNLRTNFFVIESHLNQIIKWNMQNENREQEIEMITKVLNSLNNSFSREKDAEIREIKNIIRDYLPGEIYKREFMERIKNHVKDTD